MRNSHSAAPLLPTNVDIAKAGPAERIRHRSSLDTFVIPGRTRMPSSKVSQPEPMDIQIAQGLLNANTLKVPNKQSHRVEKHGWLAPKSKKSSMLKGKARSNEENPVPASPKEHKNKSKKASLKFAGREIVIVPRNDQHDQHNDLVSRSQEHQLQVREDDPRDSFDGPPSEGSRATSTTWSTISHRIFSNSSGNSQNRSSPKSVEEYNLLALRHGLPQFAVTPEMANTGVFSFTLKVH